MISVAAIRMQQFGVQFYQASLSASDIDKLVRFEVLSYGEQAQPVRGGRKKARRRRAKSTGTCWSGASRPTRRPTSARSSARRSTSSFSTTNSAVRRAICRRSRAPSSSPATKRCKFEPLEDGAAVGTLKVPEREGILRAIDGQHRLLALHADIEHFGDEPFTVPAVIFDRLPDDHVVQMFVTINAKHTRLNASHLVSLSGRQLYSDESLAAAHDIVRALNDREDSPLYGEIKLLGVGKGRVAQAPLAQELKKLFAAEAFGAGPQGRGVPRGVEAVLRQLPEAGGAGVRRRLERPEVQHQERDGASRVHPGCAGRRPASRSGARGSHRLPRDRTGHLAVGTTNRRPPLRNGRGMEAIGHETVESLAKELRLGAAVSRRSCRLRPPGGDPSTSMRGSHRQKKGHRPKTMPCGCADDLAPQQLTAPCRKYSSRLHPSIEQVVYRTFYCVFSVCTHC